MDSASAAMETLDMTEADSESIEPQNPTNSSEATGTPPADSVPADAASPEATAPPASLSRSRTSTALPGNSRGAARNSGRNSGRSSGRRSGPAYPTPQQIADAAYQIFGTHVEKMTAPGGRKRASIRVHLPDRTVIATYRPASRRRDMELRVLRRLSEEGAGVPKLLGVHDNILFQSDAGSRRLTSELVRCRNEDLEHLVTRTYESLWEIKAAARRSGLVADVPPVATGLEWLRDFTHEARNLSSRLAIRSPRLKLAPLAQSLVTLPVEFIKWDARPGNASVQDDGSIVWFDWEHAGRRRGVEDFAFLLGDEFWTLPPTKSLSLFARSCPHDPDTLVPLLRRFSTMQIVQRISLIESQQRKHGWNREDRARRYDRIGTAPELLRRLRDHGVEMALMDPQTEPLVDWFDDVTKAILSQ